MITPDKLNIHINSKIRRKKMKKERTYESINFDDLVPKSKFQLVNLVRLSMIQIAIVNN